ncbi:hypothetical protein AVEN_251307-1, partial [Araneus ventricosus]
GVRNSRGPKKTYPT